MDSIVIIWGDWGQMQGPHMQIQRLNDMSTAFADTLAYHLGPSFLSLVSSSGSGRGSTICTQQIRQPTAVVLSPPRRENLAWDPHGVQFQLKHCHENFAVATPRQWTRVWNRRHVAFREGERLAAADRGPGSNRGRLGLVR